MQDRKKSQSISGWIQVISFLAVYLALFLLMSYLVKPESGATAFDWLLISLSAAAGLSIVLVMIFARFIFRNDPTILGLSANGQLRNSIAGACLGAFLICGGSMLLFAGGWLNWTGSTSSIADIFLVALIILVSAFSEELVFRGYILGRLLSSTNRFAGLAVSSLVFAFFHVNNPDAGALAVTNIFLGGTLLGLTYTYTRNIWFSFMLHFTWNFFQGPLLGIPVSGITLPSLVVSDINGPVLITGGSFGLEGSLIQGILLLGCNVALWQLNEKKNS